VINISERGFDEIFCLQIMNIGSACGTLTAFSDYPKTQQKIGSRGQSGAQ